MSRWPTWWCRRLARVRCPRSWRRWRGCPPEPRCCGRPPSRRLPGLRGIRPAHRAPLLAGVVSGRRMIVTDYNAGRHWGDFLEPAFARVPIMPGEQSKTVAHAEIVWTEMVRHGLTAPIWWSLWAVGLSVTWPGSAPPPTSAASDASRSRPRWWLRSTRPTGARPASTARGQELRGRFHQPAAVICDPFDVEHAAARGGGGRRGRGHQDGADRRRGTVGGPGRRG